MWKDIQKRFNSIESYVSLALGLAVVLVLGSLIYNYTKGKQGTGTETKDKTQETKEQNQTLPTKHTVVKGDTLWSISLTYYKSGYNWVSIQKENALVNPDHIEVGQVLMIPNVTPIVVPEGQTSSASTEAGQEKKYTVVAGDSLWKIALSQYSSGYKWVEIAKANHLTNPDLIYPGTVVSLP